MECSMENLKETIIQAGYKAHSGTSWSPEKRAEYEWQDLKTTMDEMTAKINSLPIPEEKKGEEIEKMQAYMVKKKLQLLYIRSRLISPMITGPARFPTHRQSKFRDRYASAVSDYVAMEKTLIRRVLRKYDLLFNGVRINDTSAAEKTRRHIESIETENGRMKAINAAFRKYGKDNFMNHIELSEMEKRAVLHNLSTWHNNPYPAYCLSNNNGNKSRLIKKLAEIERREKTFSEKGNEELVSGDIKVVFNITENRTQIFFPGKPDDSTRSRLKSNAFRWSPTIGCWQAYYNGNSKAFAQNFVAEK